MRQLFLAAGAALLAIFACAAMPGAVSAGSVEQAGQLGQRASQSGLLQQAQGYGYSDYGSYGYGRRRYYDDDYTPPPPPRPRIRHRNDPGWTPDGQPRFRSQRFTPDFCYRCYRVCDGDGGCPQSCWGWRRYCPRGY